jgi:Spy/CpxP family protein refolding chaperone
MIDSLFLAAALILTLSPSRAAAEDAAQTNAVAQPGGALPGASSAPTPAASAPAGAGHTSLKTTGKFKGKLVSQPAKPTTIFDFQKEIGLSDDQIATMKGLVASLEAKFRNEKQAGEQASAEVRRLLQSDGDIKDIRAKLQDLANLEVEHQLGEIEASRAVAKILTPEQQGKWRAIQGRMNAQRAAAPQPAP